MSDTPLSVTIAVDRPDGTVEHVRIGTATPSGDGFVVRLNELRIGNVPRGAVAETPWKKRETAAPPSYGGGGGGGSGELPRTFPNYGRAKGAPIQGASPDDLNYYASGAKRSLADESKSRWHDRDQAMLAAIDAELVRQGAAPSGGGGAPAARPAYGGGSSRSAPTSDRPEPPPPGDDDVPF